MSGRLLHLASSWDRGAATIHARGEVCAATAGCLVSAVQGAVGARATSITIDCGHIFAVDVACIEDLMVGWAEIKTSAAMPVQLANLSPAVRRALTAAGLAGPAAG